MAPPLLCKNSGDGTYKKRKRKRTMEMLKSWV
jgi:hypothetical protein